MGTLNWYITRNLAVYMMIAIGVATFILLVGQFAKVFELVTQGIDPSALGLFVLYRMPQALSFTIPLGFFVAVVLVFNRMSAENEITALRASGISLLQVISPVIVISILLSAVCYELHLNMVPTYTTKAKWLVKEQSLKNPLDLIVPGQHIEIFDHHIIYVGAKDKTTLHDVHIYVLDDDGHIREKTDAARGEITLDDDIHELALTLVNPTVTTVDPDAPYDPNRMHRMHGQTTTIWLPYGEQLTRRSLLRRIGEMNRVQLFARIQMTTEIGRNATPLFVELHKRLAMTLAPFSLMLAGIPFVIWQSRRENNSRLFACIIIPLTYYILIALFDTLAEEASAHADALMWLPNAACQVGGIWGLWLKR